MSVRKVRLMHKDRYWARRLYRMVFGDETWSGGSMREFARRVMYERL